MTPVVAALGVVAANVGCGRDERSLAVEGGLEMFDAGGGAVDAAVAVAVVLAVGEPVSPGSAATSSVVAEARRRGATAPLPRLKTFVDDRGLKVAVQ